MAEAALAARTTEARRKFLAETNVMGGLSGVK
jgi:hypothetical protein